mmetsp:Transcript_19200/g.55737  ORF Transcript_19200/g.55737 Transcript_19200/m.55737 type:complete len:539 (+) Transcript_19200:1006-2622(+)
MGRPLTPGPAQADLSVTTAPSAGDDAQLPPLALRRYHLDHNFGAAEGVAAAAAIQTEASLTHWARIPVESRSMPTSVCKGLKRHAPWLSNIGSKRFAMVRTFSGPAGAAFGAMSSSANFRCHSAFIMSQRASSRLRCRACGGKYVSTWGLFREPIEDDVSTAGAGARFDMLSGDTSPSDWRPSNSSLPGSENKSMSTSSSDACSAPSSSISSSHSKHSTSKPSSASPPSSTPAAAKSSDMPSSSSGRSSSPAWLTSSASTSEGARHRSGALGVANVAPHRPGVDCRSSSATPPSSAVCNIPCMRHEVNACALNSFSRSERLRAPSPAALSRRGAEAAAGEAPAKRSSCGPEGGEAGPRSRTMLLSGRRSLPESQSSFVVLDRDRSAPKQRPALRARAGPRPRQRRSLGPNAAFSGAAAAPGSAESPAAEAPHNKDGHAFGLWDAGASSSKGPGTAHRLRRNASRRFRNSADDCASFARPAEMASQLGTGLATGEPESPDVLRCASLPCNCGSAEPGCWAPGSASELLSCAASRCRRRI